MGVLCNLTLYNFYPTDLVTPQTDLQLVVGLFVLDPQLPLRLRVDEQRKASCLGDDDAVLNGEVVVREPLWEERQNHTEAFVSDSLKKKNNLSLFSNRASMFRKQIQSYEKFKI